MITNQTCANRYDLTRAYRATDACGNITNCAQVITVFDNTPPLISCSGNPTPPPVQCATQVPAVNIALVVTSDNCGGTVTVTHVGDVITNQTCANSFTLTRTYRATDDCGNFADCVQVFTVFDNTPPLITCPGSSTPAPVQCATQVPAVNIALVVTSDNCGGTATVTHVGDVITNQTCANRFTLTRTYRATDDCGNFADCTQVFTVFDNTPPAITCPANATVQCASLAPVNPALVVSTDNCGGTATVTHAGDVITNQTCANRYTLTRTYQAADACGNLATCAQVITVFDSTPPTVSCPANATVQCASLVPAVNIALVVASDNCGGAATVIHVGDVITNQTCADRFTLTRTYQAADACGNLATCAQVITVFDSTPPTVSCPANATVQCADQVPAINTGLVTGSDNCGGAAIVTHFGDAISNQVCANQFVLTRTYRATDVCGNVANCTQVITVFDNIPPTLNFTDPLVVPGSTINVQCYGQDPNWNLPTFNAGSVTASDICAGNVTITFNEVLENAGDCDVDGYINRYRLTWTATDVCGNSSSTFLFLALIDTIPPVIFGVPADITVNCNEIPELPPLVYATDECLCACVVFSEQTQVEPYCQNGQVIVRTWTAMDDCGNTSVETQIITLIDTIGPDWFILLPELAGITNDTILNYSCNDGYPAFLDLLDEQFVLGPNSCGASFVLSFDTHTTVANNCELLGYLEQRTFHWVGVDDCGNLSELTIHVRLTDVEPPLLIGVPDTTCLGDPQLGLVYATDACGTASVQFQDSSMPNPCGSGKATRRIYVAQDDCGNIARDTAIIIPNDNNEPTIWFVNPVLEGMEVGEVLTIDCAAQNGQYTSFGTVDVNVDDGCPAGLTVNFTETLIGLGVCGNSSELIVTANIVDETSPVFVNFSPEVTIACNAELPELTITDNCGEVFTSTWDTIIYGDCIFEYDMQRIITATDVCGNTTTQQQTIHVGDGSGPVFSGIEEVICDDVSIPDVTAYDSCAQEFVDVTMQEDTLDLPCNGLVIERTWTAVDICGNVTISHQTIIINDETPPVIEVPLNSIIQAFLDSTYHLVYTSQNDMIAQLNTLDSSSVFIADDCDQSVVIVFTVEISYSDNCLEDGYFERRKYTWVATDVCGNSTTFTFSVDIADNTPPVFGIYPSDITIVCEELPAIPVIIADDGAQSVTIVFTEVIEPGVGIGVFIVTRTWTATDACGNVTIHVQRIKWIPDTFLECNIILPPIVDCNTHGIVINSSYTGGNGPLTYNWEIVGEDCFIQRGQGTPKITVYVGWSDVKIILTVTDEFGCVSMCMVTQSCEFSVDNLNPGLPPTTNAATDANSSPNQAPENHLKPISLWPNPADGSVNLGFESPLEEEVEFSFTNFLGQVVLSEKINVQKGFNAHKIDVSQVRDGSYLVQVKTANEVHTKIVVIMHSN
ncbi:MAG: T9SS type A sorting domain-containing protein [Saprospiraceae bacterium]|nr:T9SS type A sorting domain-containing protein [Saprospiraceae bacterium]